VGYPPQCLYFSLFFMSINSEMLLDRIIIFIRLAAVSAFAFIVALHFS
jgi:hypothetical protein